MGGVLLAGAAALNNCDAATSCGSFSSIPFTSVVAATSAAVVAVSTAFVLAVFDEDICTSAKDCCKTAVWVDSWGTALAAGVCCCTGG